ncbi:DinB family protein [Psychroflexus sp. YR1-1]|uniref:DinB family protein n=1 Tax=Psychroflexus aurantiacus TaxID=2709310 RepID=A0A6B3R416_9FLAO|nr:DinB family protein [Psychroflexus aurantiacus]NEV94310.1 DinB family protein [Psychroflexus aurantiacus]
MSGSAERKQLVNHLKGGEAFMPLDEILDKITFEKLGVRPQDLPYSFYEVFYHIICAQKDILEYSTSGDYKSATWPEDYWPEKSSPESEKDWLKLREDYFRDRKTFENFILDPKNDLNLPVKNSDEHSLLREILLVMEHTAYHTGQLLLILRLLGLHK